MSEFPGFPTLPASGAAQKLPLTARATVTAATSSGMGPPAPVQVASKSSNLEHRNKRDPLLTRLLYGMLAWATGNVPLEKGYSQVDWMRLMRGTPQARLRRDITMAEVKQHRTREDAWMVFRNKVYNITPYFKFHPGGADMLLKAAGRDGTSLFMKYHPWVNIDALMEKCLLGTLAEETPVVGLGAGAKGVQGEGVAAAALQGKGDGIEGGKGQLLPLAKEGGDGVGDGQEWQVAAATGPGSVGGDAPAQPGQDDMNALVPGDAGNEAAGQKQ